MEVSESLKKLAEKCKAKNHTLYIVGGCVRDSIIGHTSHDIDIASNILPEDMIDIAHSIKLKAHIINKRLGTVHISNGKESYEYTPFRRESYSTPGEHSPDSVEFVNDINIDYQRRDITINSIYYDILEDKIIDPAHGMDDLNRKIIRTTSEPKITLNDDGLRILRIIRFASALDYKIEKSTLLAMKNYRNRLKAISKERITEELHKCATADLKYGSQSRAFLDTITRLHLISILFGSKMHTIKKFNKIEKDKFYALPDHARIIGLYVMLIHKTLFTHLTHAHLAYYVNCILGHDGLKESSAHIRTCEKILLIAENLNHKKDEINATINYLLSSTGERLVIDMCLNKKAKTILSDNIAYIKDKKLPLSVQELDIEPKDLLDARIDSIYISKIMQALYNLVLNMKIENTKSSLLAAAVQIHLQFKNIQNKQGSKS